MACTQNKNAIRSKFIEFAALNRNTIGPNETVISCLVTGVFEATAKNKPEEDNKTRRDTQSKSRDKTFHRIRAITLNRKPMSITLSPPRNAEPDSKRRRDDSGAAAAPPSRFTLDPSTPISVTSFDRTHALLLKNTPCMCKIYVRADLWNGRPSFTASRVVIEESTAHALDTTFFNRYVKGSTLGEIPTRENLDQEIYKSGENGEDRCRYFVLPLTTDDNVWTYVEPLIDLTDPRRFAGKDKDQDDLMPSVTVEEGPDKVFNRMEVAFRHRKNDEAPEESIVMRMAYSPTVWACFGVSCVDKWAACAGRMISRAKGWYVIGSSKLHHINRLASNVDQEGEYSIDGSAALENTVQGSAGYVTLMTLNLPETIKACGRVLDKAWIADKMSLKNYRFSAARGAENPLNVNPLDRLGSDVDSCVFNMSEMTDTTRTLFIDHIKDDARVTVYGIFPTAQDGPYEASDVMEFLKQNPATSPAAVFAIMSNHHHKTNN